MNELIEILDDIETTEEYNGYICSVRDAIIIVILGSICGLKNVKQIHQWALNEKISEFLKEKFLSPTSFLWGLYLAISCTWWGLQGE